jgi:hypothetical protein
MRNPKKCAPNAKKHLKLWPGKQTQSMGHTWNIDCLQGKKKKKNEYVVIWVNYPFNNGGGDVLKNMSNGKNSTI